MMKLFFIRFVYSDLLLISLTLLGGCFQDVLDIDFSEIDNQIVIEGKITNELANHKVKISYSSSYSDPYEYPPVTGADVTVTDNEGELITFEETEPGTYKSILMQGVPGRTYTLNVTYQNNRYEAVSYMPEPVVLDSGEYVLFSDMRRYNFKYYFSDKTGATEFCMFEVYMNDYYRENESFLYNGKYYEGENIVNEDIYGSNLLNDIIRIEVYSMDETSFNIYTNMRTREDEFYDDGEIDVASLFKRNRF